jgi:hypothetical protein
MNTTPTTPSPAAAREPSAAGAAAKLRPEDERPVAEAFEHVMQRQREARADLGADDAHDSDGQAEGGTPDIALTVLCARLMPGPSGAVAQPAASAAGPATEARWQQIADYVERLLVEATLPRNGAPAAVFLLRGDLLHETSAALTRVDSGWLLRIRSDDQRLRGADLDRHESALRERFARRGLGELTIEHGELPFAA